MVVGTAIRSLPPSVDMRNRRVQQHERPQPRKQGSRPFPNLLHRWAIYNTWTYLEVMMSLANRWLFVLFVIWIPALSSGQSSNALHFDGVNDFVATTCDGVSGNGARTVEAWINTTANCVPNAGGIQQVILDWGTFVTGGRFTLNLLWSNSVRIEVGGSGLSGSTAINDGQWHHVAASYDPSVAVNKFKLYIDGQLETQGNITTAVNTGSQYNVRIGKRTDDVNHFEGAIDEVRIWDAVRTSAEIAANWNSELCAPHPDLIGYYRFNQGTAGGNNVGENDLDDAFGTADGNLYLFSYVGATSNWVAGAPLPGAAFGEDSVSSCTAWTAEDGSVWTETGTYSVAYPMATGCDSIVEVAFTYSPLLGDTLSVSTCEELWIFSGDTLTESGLYELALTSADGACDSLAWLDLSFAAASDTIFTSASLCAGETTLLPDGNVTGEAGTYIADFVNTAGCDSVVVTTVEVTDAAVELASLETTEGLQWYVVDGPAGMEWIWLDCEANFAPLPDQTQDTLTLALAGSYAVVSLLGGCADTTACVEIPVVDNVADFSPRALSVFPNPVRPGARLDIFGLSPPFTWTLMDVRGCELASGTSPISSLTLPPHVPSGTHFLRLTADRVRHTTILLIQ